MIGPVIDLETKTVMVRVSLKEAHLLKVLRESLFATCEVIVKNGEPVRIVAKNSTMLSENEGIKIAEKKQYEET